MELIAWPIVELMRCIQSSSSKYWKRHRGLKANTSELKRRVEELNCRKRDIQLRLETELVPTETASKEEVQLWLQRVEIINVEIIAIEEKSERVKCFSRAGLGKKVISKREEVEQLYRDGEFPNGLVISLPKQTGDFLPTRILKGETTSKRNMKAIWTFLMDDQVRKIGIFGMGGIGKTTVMKHINNCLLERKEIFDDTIWVTVSKASSVIKLQDAIARKLEFDISRHDDETTRAAKLFAELSKRGKYLLILDDLWQVFDLEDVGIPEPTPQNGCKLVLTTRLLNVCLNMSCKAVQMHCLSETEALNLFLDTVGHDVLSIPNLEGIMNLVVKECACLPLAIVTIAGSLRGIVDYNQWKTALEDLRASSKDITTEIFEKLKFSYDRLNNKNLQACLLYCALFPEDHEIERDVLIDYLVAEEIIKGRNRQVELERGQAMLNKLVNACLLESMTDRYGKAYVKMHDLIRDMAIRIANDNPRFLVEAGIGLKYIPDEENWRDQNLAKVSLMYNNISSIPSSFESPNCPNLSTLLLNVNHRLSSISNNFFLHMKGLSVLDLSETSIENMPESISELVNLTALLLRKCHKLRYVPSLAKLRSLKKLDLYESGIKQVPQGMEKLAKLRYLDLDSRNLEIIPSGILCKLSNLQFLSLNQACGAKIRGEELVYLRKLENLYCVLYDLESLNAYVGSLEMGGLNYYILQLGFTGDGLWFPVHKSGKVVYLTNFDISECVEKRGQDRAPLLLPQDVKILALQSSHLQVSSLCELTSFEHASNLRSCCVKNCGGIEHLFSYSSSIIHLLQSLEILVLEELRDLRSLIRGENGGPSSPLPPGTFSSLKELIICGCDNIRRLFITAPLPNLQEIVVSECEELVEIISTSGDENGGTDHHAISTVTLPKLRKLHVFILQKLQSMPVVADSLENVFVCQCPKLKRIPFLDREPCPAFLRYVRIGEEEWQALEWHYPDAKEVIESIRR